MRAFLILLMSFFGLVTSQAQQYQESPRSAAILSDTRYLSGDGTFGASYKQEDGVEFKEESDEFGNRKGSYSYIDPTGQRRTVTYTAGKDGFQATGDHIPTAAPQVLPEPVQPEYVPLPEYNPPDYQFPKGRFYDSRFETQNRYERVTASPKKPESKIQFQYEYQHNPTPVRYQPPNPEYESQYEEKKYESPQYRPTKYEHSQYQTRKYEPPRYQSPQYQSPQYQSPQHQSPQYQTPQYQTPQYQTPQYQSPQYEQPEYQKPLYSPPNRPPPPVSEYRPLSRPPPQYNEVTTSTPRRFYPPGKLDFNRTPDGFSYTFSKT
ncbi:early nodulin-75-like [Belonocnema kinseyi]|uniref:early nodulin-75-like n=1 Tax=Belonocnema kinseyi TaxID=2817044 RepID=UPI00143D0D9C|nr:early nodulin-75-like [Belonocnema kinseyi]